MFNILGFFTQTLEVSLLAIIRMILKTILKDKLSPRWQYGIWSFLIIDFIMPAGMLGTYIFPRINVYIETYKDMIE